MEFRLIPVFGKITGSTPTVTLWDHSWHHCQLTLHGHIRILFSWKWAIISHFCCCIYSSFHKQQYTPSFRYLEFCCGMSIMGKMSECIFSCLSYFFVMTQMRHFAVVCVYTPGHTTDFSVLNNIILHQMRQFGGYYRCLNIPKHILGVIM